jgi:hypothetical protein
MTLTEQWKKGELESGWYYIECIDGSNHCFTKDYYDEEFECFDNYQYRGIKEVLEPVPSYEEWQELRKFLEEFNALDVAKENQQLKELLRKAKGIITAYRLTGNQSTYPNSDMKECVAKITNAIGEKK